MAPQVTAHEAATRRIAAQRAQTHDSQRELRRLRGKGQRAQYKLNSINVRTSCAPLAQC